MTAEDRLLALPRFATDTTAYKPGLERMRALLSALGDPHLGLPVIHVAGTNGKGSTASLAASIAQAAGLRVGLHTSPHLLTLRERIRIDGVPASEAWLASALDRVGDAIEAQAPSFFEATGALSLLCFAERAVDLAVIEVGLGGRLDATNVVGPVVSVVTHVGLDHTDLLGETVEEIAVEKAGIARPGIPLVHAVEGGAAPALKAEAERRGAPVEAVRQTCRVDARESDVRIVTPMQDYGAVRIGLPGAHQRWNAALAARAVEVSAERLGRTLSAEAVRAGLAEVVARSGLRGRGEALPGHPRVVLDVAHNADGWRAALVSARADGRLWALVGLMADKDADALGAALAGAEVAEAWTLGLDGARALAPESLADVLRSHGLRAEVVFDAAAALARFQTEAGPDDRLLVTGSHQTVAAVLSASRYVGRTPSGAVG